VFFDQARNLCSICFIFPLFTCTAVAGVSSGLPILFSCFVPLSHASTVVVSRFILLLLMFSMVPPLRAGFLAQICWSGFIFLTFSLRSSLAGALFSYCCFLIPACAGRTSIKRPNLCQAFGPVSSRAGRVTVAVPMLGRSRDSEILVLSRFRSLICRCFFPHDEFKILLPLLLSTLLIPAC
jgi:hypothetical protein